MAKLPNKGAAVANNKSVAGVVAEMQRRDRLRLEPAFQHIGFPLGEAVECSDLQR